MDNVWQESVNIAINKTKATRFFDMETGEIGEIS